MTYTKVYQPFRVTDLLSAQLFIYVYTKTLAPVFTLTANLSHSGTPENSPRKKSRNGT